MLLNRIKIFSLAFINVFNSQIQYYSMQFFVHLDTVFLPIIQL